MKKIILLTLVLLSIILLSACGNNSPEVADLQSRIEIIESSSQSAEDEYLEFVRNWFKMFRKDFNKQNEVIQKMIEKPTLLADEDWIMQLTYASVDINTSCSLMLKYDITLVPEEYLAGHELLVQSTTDFKKAMELILNGIKEKDVLNGLNDSIEYIDSGTEYLTKATDFFAKVL